MKVGFVQFEPRIAEKESNVEKSIKLIENAGEADLLVLPELCNTGYVFKDRGEVEKLSEPYPSGKSLKAWIEIAKEKNIHIVAGFAEKKGNKFFNSAALIGPQGPAGAYRKVHLFYEEKKWFSPGTEGFKVFDIGKARIGLMICFDWIFPESARIMALNGADIICHPANLVLPYCQRAMLARSVENRIFTITANRTGEERGMIFTGGSQITGPKMQVLSRASEKPEEVTIVDIDPRDARDKNINELNNIFDDRRTELYRDLIR